MVRCRAVKANATEPRGRRNKSTAKRRWNSPPKTTSGDIDEPARDDQQQGHDARLVPAVGRPAQAGHSRGEAPRDECGAAREMVPRLGVPVTRVSEPTVAYVGRWNGRDHRRYIRTAK